MRWRLAAILKSFFLLSGLYLWQTLELANGGGLHRVSALLHQVHSSLALLYAIYFTMISYYLPYCTPMDSYYVPCRPATIFILMQERVL